MFAGAAAGLTVVAAFGIPLGHAGTFCPFRPVLRGVSVQS